MQLQWQPIRVMEESHLLPGEGILADRFCLNAQRSKLTHRIFHRIHPEGQMAKPISFFARPARTLWAAFLDEKLQLKKE